MDEIKIIGSSLYHPGYPHVNVLSIAITGGELSDDQEQALRTLGGNLFLSGVINALQWHPPTDGTLNVFIEVGTQAQLEKRREVFEMLQGKQPDSDQTDDAAED